MTDDTTVHVTHVVCARCGTETAVRSDEPGPFFDGIAGVRFNCPACDVTYTIQTESAGDEYVYVGHCSNCDGMIGVCVADADDVDEFIAPWLRGDDTYVKRYSVAASRMIPLCEAATMNGTCNAP